MKKTPIILIILTAILLTGWQFASLSPTEKKSSEPTRLLADSIDDITGVWLQFPNGIAVQFSENGSARFGIESDGAVLGYKGQARFEEDQLLIQFVDYKGPVEVCQTATGVYRVQLQENDNIQFFSIHDDCQFREVALEGYSVVGPPIAMGFRPAD